MPRTRSSAFARTARRCAAGDSPSAAGNVSATHAETPSSKPRVRREEIVERRLVRRPEARVAVVAVAEALELRVIRDVARRLLEIRGEARPLEDLREEVRRPLARDVRAAELRDRVVAVAEEDRLVELRRAIALAQLHDRHLRQRVRELVEEQPAQRPDVARVAREERALDRLGQVDEREDRPVEVREMRSEARPLLVGELLDRSRDCRARSQRRGGSRRGSGAGRRSARRGRRARRSSPARRR